MKQISFLLLFSFLWIQFSAGQELPDYSPEDASIVASIDSIRRIELKLSNFSNVRYIPLETDTNCLIGYIDKTLVRDNRIYVADFYKATSLFVFDMNGRFLFKIARMGEGPGEYLSFRDFDIQSNGDIYMFDYFGRKFLVFDSEGKYLRKILADFIVSYFCLAKDKMYWSKIQDPEYAGRIATLAVHDMTDESTEFLLKNKKFLLDNEQFRYVPYAFFTSPSGVTYYSPRFSEIIYAIDEKGVRPAIGIRNLRKPPEGVIRKWERDAENFEFRTMENDELYFKENTHIYETDRHIAFKCINGLLIPSEHLIYNKSSGTFSAFRSLFFNKFLCVNGPVGSTGKEFFGTMTPFPEYGTHRHLLETREDLKNWQEEDNPVIVLFNLEL
jgi:hypothetical protein